MTKCQAAVAREARRAGLFLLYHQAQRGKQARWEFLSATTGKTLLTWFPLDGNWSGFGNKRGKARSPFGALHAAIRLDRTPK